MRERAVILIETRAALPIGASDFVAALLRDTLHLLAHPRLRADLYLAANEEAQGLMKNLLPEGCVLIPFPGSSGNPSAQLPVDLMEGVFSTGQGAGYGSICVLTDTTPHLPVAFLIEAFGRLERGGNADLVFGPEDAGGWYLLGARASARNHLAGVCDNLLSTDADALATVQQRAQAAGLTTALLPPWYAITSPDARKRLATDLDRRVAIAPATRPILKTLETIPS